MPTNKIAVAYILPIKYRNSLIWLWSQEQNAEPDHQTLIRFGVSFRSKARISGPGLDHDKIFAWKVFVNRAIGTDTLDQLDAIMKL